MGGGRSGLADDVVAFVFLAVDMIVAVAAFSLAATYSESLGSEEGSPTGS